jgi:uncharacterized protein
MKARTFAPLKLDVAAFAREAASLQGEWSLMDLPRLAEAGAPERPAQDWPVVRWTARGELRQPRGGEAQVWLLLEAQAQVWLSCQRCLEPVQSDLQVSRWFRFARDEAAAAELDMDSDDDVLALVRNLDLRELAEDELLLELPVVPRHEACPDPLPVPTEEAGEVQEQAEASERPNPFAALAALKKGQAGQS